MKTLHLKQSPPFASCPPFVELGEDKILLNDMCLPKHIDASAYNPHNVRLWVIGHTFGAICAVWASWELEALDVAVDANLLDCFMITDPNAVHEDTTRLGNADEPFNLSDAWIGEVCFDASRDIGLILALVRRYQEGESTL